MEAQGYGEAMNTTTLDTNANTGADTASDTGTRLAAVACASETSPEGCVEVRDCQHCYEPVCMDHDDATFCGWLDEYVHAECHTECSHCHSWGRIAAYPRT